MVRWAPPSIEARRWQEGVSRSPTHAVRRRTGPRKFPGAPRTKPIGVSLKNEPRGRDPCGGGSASHLAHGFAGQVRMETPQCGVSRGGGVGPSRRRNGAPRSIDRTLEVRFSGLCEKGSGKLSLAAACQQQRPGSRGSGNPPFRPLPWQQQRPGSRGSGKLSLAAATPAATAWFERPPAGLSPPLGRVGVFTGPCPDRPSRARRSPRGTARARLGRRLSLRVPRRRPRGRRPGTAGSCCLPS